MNIIKYESSAVLMMMKPEQQGIVNTWWGFNYRWEIMKVQLCYGEKTWLHRTQKLRVMGTNEEQYRRYQEWTDKA